MFKVLINATAESDMQSAADWWKQNRSTQQAEHWYDGIYKAIKTLSENPERCSLAAENEHTQKEIRQLLFGVSQKTTHRILFYVDGNSVTVFRVLHVARAKIRDVDLASLGLENN